MRIRASIITLACCCAGLAACTASASQGPDTTVTTPAVGAPAPPASVQGALSREAFTPYAALGRSNNDGLAPGESSNALANACMTAEGYPDGPAVPFSVRSGLAGVAFSQPWGAWGYLGVALAEQYGFLLPPGSALSALGIDGPPSPTALDSLPIAEQTAIGKCATIEQDFSDETQSGPLAGIVSLSGDIYNDLLRDQAVTNATKAWSGCMAKNGYTYSDPQTAWRQELQNVSGGGRGINLGQPVSTAANQAQIAMAVADANCSQSTDLAGIYFAVQASYEQQIVNANQQALTAAVQQYRADYRKELSDLPKLLSTTKITPFPRKVPASGAGRS